MRSQFFPKRSMSLLLCMFTLAFLCGNAEKIIIDTDGGADDAMAILLLLRAESLREHQRPHYEVVGITCVYGNTEEENAEINVLKTLTVANRSDIPVYGGAKKPLIGNFSSDGYFGKDGFGDTHFDEQILGSVDRSKHASVALVELSKKHEGSISIAVLGPITNIAMAISLDGEFLNRVNKFHVMGTSITGLGLNKPGVDFNVGLDPESSFILFNSTASSRLNVIPLETEVTANIPKDWRRKVLGKYDSPYVAFMNSAERVSLPKEEAYYAFADPLVAATILWPEIIVDSLVTNVQVVVDGAARGAVLVDYTRNAKLRNNFNANIVRAIDAELYKQLLIYYLTCEKVAC